MNIKRINAIFSELMSQSQEIQGAALVSSNGQPLTEPIGIDNHSAMIISGIFLHLAQTTGQEFNWEEIESITIRGQEGHFIFASCYQEVFLLVKASKNLFLGLLEREINLTGKKLQAELEATELAGASSSELSPFTQSSSKSTSLDLASSDKTYTRTIEINDKFMKNSGIRYRGLRSLK